VVEAAALLNNSVLLRELFARLQEGLAVVGGDGRVLMANPALCRLTGFAEAELVGSLPPYPYCPPPASITLARAFVAAARGPTEPMELTLLCKDGRRFVASVAPFLVGDDDRGGHMVATTVVDVSGRKRLELELQASRERWRSISETPFDFVVIIGRDLKYRYVNHTAPGVRVEDLIGQATPLDFTPSEQHHVLREAYEYTFATGRPTSYESYVPELERWFSSIVGPIFEHGHVGELSILTRDITESKRAEQNAQRLQNQLRQAQRLDLLGKVAGGVAHEFNNLLTPILSHSELAALGLPESHPARQHLEHTVDAARQAREVVRQMLTFARHDRPSVQPICVSKAIESWLRLWRSSAPKNVDVILDVEEGVTIAADPVSFQQILGNLCRNACDAIGEAAGRVTVSARPFVVAKRAGGARATTGPATALGSGQYVEIVVEDTGEGMDAETAAHVFEPFFTTKPPAQGTGLGLSVIHGIVSSHGGAIGVTSQPGHGTRFTVYLPAAAQAVPAVRHRPSSMNELSQSALAAGRPRTVLSVDDDKAVLEAVRQVLRSQMVDVVAVNSATAALDWLVNAQGPVDALLTDFAMPQMTGLELVHRARAIRPGLPAIVMTGYHSDSRQAITATREAIELLEKPFDPAQLIETLERVLAQSSGRLPAVVAATGATAGATIRRH
jgi:PAS domain S-box-containing protein